MNHKFTLGFRGLIAWKEAKLLVLEMYKITASFPSSEQYGLTSQIRRAAVSIMANLAEGSAMPTQAHRNAYYARSRGSASEVDNYMDIVVELGYITKEKCIQFNDHCARIVYLITRLIKA